MWCGTRSWIKTMKLISHGPVNSLKMAFMLFWAGLNPVTLEVKGVRAQCPEPHSPLIFVSKFFRNISWKAKAITYLHGFEKRNGRKLQKASSYKRVPFPSFRNNVAVCWVWAGASCVIRTKHNPSCLQWLKLPNSIKGYCVLYLCLATMWYFTKGNKIWKSVENQENLAWQNWLKAA